MSPATKRAIGVSVAWAAVCALGGPVSLVLLAVVPLAIGWSRWWARGSGPQSDVVLAESKPPKALPANKKIDITPELLGSVPVYGMANDEPPFSEWRPGDELVSKKNHVIFQAGVNAYQLYLYDLVVAD